MKALNTLALACVFFSVLALILPVFAIDQPTVGVKKGDWVEYKIEYTGQTALPTKNMTSFRMEILNVEGTAIEANITARYLNGTLRIAIWKYNFSEGNYGGWTIISPNLNPGETFYDSSLNTTIIVEGQEQKTVAGAERTITHACDSKRIIKEWDKTTGVYTYSVERPKNTTIITQAVATNLWTPQNQEQNPGLVNMLTAAVVALTGLLTVASVIFFTKKAGLKTATLSVSAQKKIVAITIIAVVMFEIGSMFFFPFYLVGLSFAQINLIMQTIWTIMVFVSIYFRHKGNYFIHELLMLVVICAWAIGFTAVILMDPFSTSTGAFSSTPLRWIMNALHGIFSVPALVLGAWLVALWRPESTTFPSKSRKLANWLPFFWAASYIVGFFDFIALHTTFFA
jgi:hypothetical protein